jgi:acetoin utilization protein AcuB
MSHFAVPVEEYTTPNPITVPSDSPIEKVYELMNRHGIRHVPVLNGKTVVGIISERDVRVAANLSRKEKLLVKAMDIMVAEPVTVSAGAALDDVAFEMSQSKIGSVLVNDENDELLGIFTVTDALNALIEIARSLKTDEE